MIDLISERLQDIRDNEMLKQKEIAQILEITQSNYSRWETSKELIPLKKINDLCNHFNLSMDYVIGLKRNNIGNGVHKLNNNIIGQNIRRIRKRFHLTQKDLAKMLNTTQSTISAYEKGKTTLLTSFALELVKRFHISLDSLCGRNNKISK